jgi:hypothetical protein
MKRKVMISISIFVVLFVSAWIMNEQMKRNYIKFVIKDTEPMADYIFSPTEVEAEEVDTWNFKPREYIKIRKRE